MHVFKLENENLKTVISNKNRYIGVIGRIIDSNFGWLLLVILKQKQWEKFS